MIPLISSEYPATLKENLKTKTSPSLIYTRGRKGLLQEEAVAIVGSRKAGKAAMAFTGSMAKSCAARSRVVVSGFAKGVDRQALDSTLEANGKSIIVLPQGIPTFRSGFTKYYEPIVNGDVLVMSTFFPKAGWDVGFAMERNTYIYGLVDEIYVAESDFSGGTWEGVLDGLKRKRKIFVRIPGPGEKNANHRLLELGAAPVNMDGDIVDLKTRKPADLFEQASGSTVTEPHPSYGTGEQAMEQAILHLLGKGAYTSREIILALKLDWEPRKMTAWLKRNPDIRTIPGKPARFTCKDVSQPTLF
ncbi:MAG: DNA-processing protein DprA [Bacteroidales bacterium]|nr:DNA-processing protein DprA [Bacteroidales bacterium]